ncbi:MAG: hypothetical protein ACLTSX_13965 [Collinsella sp.]
MMGAVFSEMDEDWVGPRWFGDDLIGRAVEGAKVERARARLRRAPRAEHAARIIAPRGCRQPDSRQEGGVACAGLTAFSAIPGFSDSLWPPLRTEP